LLLASILLAALGVALLAGPKTEPTLKRKQVTEAELQALFPVELVPASFARLREQRDHPSVVLPPEPFYFAGYGDGSDDSILVFITVTGQRSSALRQAYSVDEICAQWSDYDPGPCPVVETTPVPAGHAATASRSSGIEGASHHQLFMRNGVQVSIVVMTSAQTGETPELLRLMVAEIDRRLTALVERKLGTEGD
jgi:hypothetical protein